MLQQHERSVNARAGFLFETRRRPPICTCVGSPHSSECNVTEAWEACLAKARREAYERTIGAAIFPSLRRK